MGVFDKINQQAGSKNSTTIIGKDTFIRGGIETEGTMFVDGRFEGNISSTSSITIGRKGVVIGDIRAKRIYVSGKLDGVIDVESIHILNHGHVLGQLTYSRINVESNGVFHGESRKKDISLNSEYGELDLNNEKTVYLKSKSTMQLPQDNN